MTARWRLQLLAEMGVGWQVRSRQVVEDQAVQRLKRIGARNGKHR